MFLSHRLLAFYHNHAHFINVLIIQFLKKGKLYEPICTSSAPTHSYSVHFFRMFVSFLHTVSTFGDVHVPSAPTFSSERRRHQTFAPVLIAKTFIYFSGKFTLHRRSLCPHTKKLLDDACESGTASVDDNKSGVLWGFMQQDVVRLADKDTSFCVGRQE